MKYCVTGCCGFIGSHLVDRLLELGHTVVGVDAPNKTLRHIEHHLRHPRFTLSTVNLTRPEEIELFVLPKVLEDVDMVFHLAANADVRHGFEHPRKDLECNTIATYNVLEMMRTAGIKKIAFASTAAIYGDIGQEYYPNPIPENCPIPVQKSLYGASKLAGEGLIQAYCAGFEMKSWIFRFSSIIGERYSHGFIYDFYGQLRKDPTKLYVIGGKDQQKSYLYVKDCIQGILKAVLEVNPLYTQGYIFNLANDNTIALTESIPIIARYLGIDPYVEWSGQQVGWIGDCKYTNLDTKKIKSLGWKPRVSIPEGIILTLKWLQNNEWILKQRDDLNVEKT